MFVDNLLVKKRIKIQSDKCWIVNPTYKKNTQDISQNDFCNKREIPTMELMSDEK